MVFIAEIGDKSQLLVLSLASRYPRLQVLAGVAAAVAIMQVFSVVAGSIVAETVPRPPVEIGAGVLFVGFTAWTLGGDADEAVPDERGDSFGTWLGGSLAMIAASAIAVLVGGALGRRLNPDTLRYAGAAVFALVGVLLLAGVG